MIRRVLAFILLAGAGAAQETFGSYLPVDVWMARDGTASASVWLDTPPHDTEAFEAALGALIGTENVEVWTDAPDMDAEPGSKTATFWEASAVRPGSSAFHWVRQVELNPQPLIEAMAASGYDELEVSIGAARTALFEVPPDIEFYHSGNYTWATGVYREGSETSPATLRYGFPREWVIARTGILLALLFLPAAGALLLRYIALRASESEAGYACAATTRRYHRLMGLFWLSWIVAVAEARPLRLVAYATPVEWVTRMSGWSIDPVVAIGILAVLPVKPILYPVYRRFPGATWRRGDLFLQGLWFNLIVMAILSVIGAFVGAAVRSDVLAAASWVILGAFAILFLHRLYLSSLGLVLQSITDGELRDRITTLSRQAGLPKLNDVSLIYFTKAPVPNAFAANGLRVMVTEFLLKALSKREVDAIVAHELSHLRAKHPHKLMLWLLLILVPVVTVAVVAGSGGMVALFTYGLTDRALFTAFAVGLPLGVLARQAIARRFEREADVAAVFITGDAEALISGLGKITRLSYTPLTTTPWRELFSTHPSTLRRAEWIGAVHGLDRERVQELLSGEMSGAEHYAVPASAELERVFSSRARSRIVQRIGLVSMVIAVGVPWLGFYLALRTSHTYPASYAVVIGVSTAIVLTAYHEWSALSGLRKLRRGLLKRLGMEPVEERWRFVTFSPNELLRLYDGFTNWDIGFIRTTNGELEFRGDAASFAIPRVAVSSIELVQRYETRWFRTARIRVSVTSRNAEQVFLFASADANVLFLANRKTKVLCGELNRWLQDDACAISPVEPDIPPLEVRGRPLSDFTSPRRYLGGMVTIAMLCVAAGVALPAEPKEGLAYMGWTGLAGLLGYGLAFLPLLFVPRRSEDYPEPLPGHDPFERDET